MKSVVALIVFCIAASSYRLLCKQANLTGDILLVIIGAAVGMASYDVFINIH